MNTDFRPSLYFEGKRRGEAVEAVKDYFSSYTGSWFEHFSDNTHPYAITERDILAVSMLSVHIPAGTTIWLLGEGKKQVSDLLRRIPVGQTIWDPDADLSRSGKPWELWELIRTNTWPNNGGSTGMGETKISKLLAAKRPDLFPIQDSVLRNALFGGKRVRDYWAPWRNFHLSDEGERLRSVAREVGADAGVDSAVPVLRIIDVVIWSA